MKNDKSKTKEELLKELTRLKKKIAGLEKEKTLPRVNKTLSEYKKKIDQSATAIFLADVKTGIILEANKKATTLLGLPRKKIIGMHQTDLHPKEELARYAKIFKQHIKNSPGISEIVFILRGDGSKVPVEITSSILDLGGQVINQGIFRDVSERIKSETALAARMRQQSVVAKLGTWALSGIALAELMDKAVKQVAAALQVEYCKVLEYRPVENEFFLRAGVGWKKGLVGKACVGGERNSQAGYTILSKKPVVVRNLSTDKRFNGPALLIDHSVISGLSVKIQGEEHPFGVFGVHTTRHREFSQNDIDFVLAVANLLAVMLKRRSDEIALVTSEARYRKLSETSLDYIFIIDRELLIKYTNAAGARLLRTTPGKITEKGLEDLFPPSEFKRMKKNLNRVFVSGKPLTIEEKYSFPGTEIFLNTRFVPLTWEKGEVATLLGVSRDITDQHQAVLALKSSEKKYRDLLELSPDPIVILQDGQYQLASPSFTRLFGYTQKDIQNGLSFFKLVQPKDRASVRKRYEDRLAGKRLSKTFELELVAKNGKHIPCETSAAQIHYNDRPADLVIIRDVTARSLAMSKLSVSEERYRTFVQKFAGIAYKANLDFTPIFFHGAVRKITGYTEKNFLAGQPRWDQIIHPEDFSNLKGLDEIASIPDYVCEREYRIIRKDGSIRWVYDSIQNTSDPDGTVNYVQGILYDITEKKTREEQRQLTQFSIDRAADIVFWIGKDARFIYVNESACRSMGFSRKELLNRSVFDVNPEMNAELWNTRWADVKKRRSLVVETQIRRKDGSAFPAEITINHMEFQGTEYHCTFAHDITERKKNEADLRESESWRRTILETLPDMMFVVDRKGEFLDFYASASEDLVLPRDKIIGTNIKDALPAELAMRTITAMQYAIEASEVQTIEFTLELPSGKKNFEARIASRSADTVIILARNITGRKDAEKQLNESREMLRLIMDNIPWSIFWKNHEHVYMGCNRQFAHAAGKRYPSNIIGLTDHDLPWKDRAEEFQANDRRVTTTGRAELNCEEQVTTRSGDRCWLRINRLPLRDAAGNVFAFLGMSEDITERKRARTALRDSEEYLRATLESSADGIIVTDETGLAIIWNDRIIEIWGVPPDLDVFREENLISEFILGQIAEPDVFFRKIKSLLNAPEENSDIICLLSGRKIEAHSCPLRREGKIAGRVWNFRDVTEKEHQEKERQKANKLESLGVLAGGLAHDFNNILTGILGNISFARMNTSKQEVNYDILSEAENASLRAKDLTQQLLTFSKGGMPIKKTLTIMGLIEASVRFAVRGSDVKCDYKIDEDLWSVDVDENQINQVIHNIVQNALQAMPHGGVIEVQAVNAELQEDELPEIKGGKYVVITIKDTGVGIQKESMSKIFDPYFTTKVEGSGLGLSISYSIINKHEGYIFCGSALEKGTTFDICIPATQKKISERPVNVDDVLIPGGRVLLMDDDVIIRRTVTRMLEMMGVQVVVTPEGHETIREYKKAILEKKPFDVVILDLTVPGGMGGKEVIKALKKIDPRVVALVSSGFSNDPVMSQFGKYGFRSVLAKPYDMLELKKALAETMDISKQKK